MPTILVTGGAGYIGSHTAIELLNAGYDVICVDNFSNSSSEIFKSIKQLTGKDITYHTADVCDTITNRRAGNVPQCWAATDKAEKELGWKAELGIKEIVKSSWKSAVHNSCRLNS